MSRRRSMSCLSVGFGAALVLLATAPAQSVRPPTEPVRRLPAAKPPVERPVAPLPPGVNELVQTFPTKEKPVTAWKVRWGTVRGNGLYINGAWFKRRPQDSWIQVLGDARLAQAFVPYQRGSPRFWDVSYNFGLDALGKADAGPFGELLTATPTAKFPTVVKEIRDRGVMFKHPTAGVRRGETMVLWGSLAAGNYRYVIEYGFQDDGTITFRVGASGHNFPGSEWVPHMHNAMFRIDVNLDDPEHNSVLLCEHLEPDGNNPATARTEHTVLKEECALDWDPYKFTMLRVISTQKKNVRNEPWSYDLVPHRMGNARHFGKDKVKVGGKPGPLEKEECTRHDFWVTRARPKEMEFHLLPDYIRGRQPIEDTDVVLWYTASCHHEPRSEDGEMQGSSFSGATHVMWCGFDLRPRNLFDRSPFFPYPQAKRPGS